MADTAGVLTGLQSIADRLIIRGLVSKIFSRSTILGLMAARAGNEFSDSAMRPGSFTLLGGGNVMTKGRRMSIEGGEKVYLPSVLTGTVGGTKHMTVRDTGPTVSNPTTNTAADKIKRMFVMPTKVHQPILIWNSDLERANGRFALIDVVNHATSLALEEVADDVTNTLFDGTVGDDTADVWDGQYGVNAVCNTTNKIYGHDRSGNTFFDGHRITTATTAALAMVEEANITNEIARYGPGIDTLLCNPTAYEAIKAEALSKNGTLIHSGTPEAAKAGIKTEAIMYGNVLITVDWGLLDYSTTGGSSQYLGETDLSSACVGLTLGDFVFQVEANASYSVSEFENLEITTEGGKDAVQAMLKLHYRFWCEKPWNQILWTNVS